MSTSRLEKFIYAICSMEVSDLPAPLSRIEILWNCLITGETPDFEPQSRNEQYLMAMLGLYELDQLPTPMSRGEKLLYKIAVGETDLSDVPGYLSRYEELLKYLIENGVLSDFEYVLYTLNQSLSTLYATVEKPVKSAILKGNTLVNLASEKKDFSGNVGGNGFIDFMINQNLKANTTYTAIFKVETDAELLRVGITSTTSSWNSNQAAYVNGNNKILLTTTTETTYSLRIRYNDTTTKSLVVTNAMLIEGDYTNEDIPYFEGMQSVKMPVLTTTGKNLFDMKYVGEELNKFKPTIVENNSLTITSSNLYHYCCEYRPINFKSNRQYTLSANIESDSSSLGTVLGFRYTDGSFVYISKNKQTLTSDINKTIDCITFSYGAVGVREIWSNIQLEESSTATSHESYKTNILSTPEDLELRGIGDVKDELNVATGEVVQKFTTKTYNGSENWALHASSSNLVNCLHFFIKENDMERNGKVISPQIKTLKYSELEDDEHISIGGSKHLHYIVNKNKLTSQNLNGFKQWLSQNPITVQYQLATPVVKTVDLTTVDQDGQPTKLKTFNDITHVEIDATNIIPSVDLEVATKISETLSTMGLQQLDISNTQNELGQTIDEQSENTDATMMATTEIYEQTL